MLLPSDVARLVLGYLQQEKLTSTCKSFIAESPHLKEYAEHHMDDGAIPGCLLSLFGKSLTTILNEFVTMKAKENEAEIPFMMTSLWKKLDLTLSQIRSMQESAAFQTNQRARTRRGINDRMRQKMLTSPLAVMGSPAPHPVALQTSTPVMAAQYILRPIITPGASQLANCLSFNGQSTAQISTPASNSLGGTTQVASTTSVQKKRSTAATSAATSSPMRRKPESQRRRRAAGSAAAEKDKELDSDTIQGIIDDDFPQLVIENAREKILSNKCLQEKLAENINKILASDSATQTTKQGDGAPNDDTAIDEILGLQGGEIHMSEEAINDILVQTELDPDFQELYDLFACVTSKAPKNTPRDSSSQNSDTKASGSEKGRKRDVAENAVQAANKIANELMGKESDRSNARTSSAEKADDASNAQQTCENETTSSRSSKGDKEPDLVPFIDGETVMDTSKEAQRTVMKAASSQIQDVEMENIPLTDDGADNYCYVVEDDVPQVSVCEDGPLPTSTRSEGHDNVKQSEVTIGEDSAKGKPSDKSEQETEKTVTVTQPSTSILQAVALDQSTPVLNCSSSQNAKDSQPVAVGSPLNKPCSDVADKQGSKSHCAEKDVVSQNAPVSIDHPVPPGQSSLAPEMDTYSTEIVVSCDSQPAVDSNIVTLNIITEDLTEDVEIHSAVRSINEENYSTIIVSPILNTQEVRRVGSASGEVESSVVGEQSQILSTSTDGLVNSINISNGDCTVYAVSGSASTADGSVIQLMPASGSTFTSTNGLFLSPCIANNVPAKQPNIMMLSNSSNNSQKQGNLYQTPPRPGSMYTVGPAISPKLPQGSTFILASPVQPMLQGVMGMFPMSLVNQSGGTFTAQPHQILHVPISKSVVPKLPLPPMSQKPLPKRAATTGKQMSNTAVDSTSRSSSSVQNRKNGEKNCASETQHESDDQSLPEIRSVVMKPVEAHKRVLCFDGTSTPIVSSSAATSNSKGQKKDKSDIIQNLAASTETVSSKRNVSKGSKKTESSTVSTEKSSKVDVGNVPQIDQCGEKRLTSSSGESGGNKENVQQVGAEKHGAGQSEKRTSSQENINPEKSGKPQQETVRKQTSMPNILRRTPQKKSSERVCSTSPLAKQASQLLQDIQFHSPTSMQRSSGDLPTPRTPGSAIEDRVTDKPSEHRRTPMNRRCHEDLGTPKPMMPPATPELPTCSPASEAGSESSVNMAAHTLMILSRASLAKSSGNAPLKGNISQSKSSKSIGKKRRLEEADEYDRRSQRKELLSPSSSHKKKKMKKRKRSSDNFPAGMDVEKFLMTLHYDE